MKKRVAIISEDLSAPWDEGIKNFSHFVGCSLAGDCDVEFYNVDVSDVGPTENIVQIPSTKTFLSARLRSELRRFSPTDVVYVPSPSSTLASFVRSFWLRRHLPGARHAMVALIPRRHPRALSPVLAGAAPDVVFVPSYKSLLHLSDLGVKAELLPVGVDLDRFRPVDDETRLSLRRKYDVPESDFVYLHIGHIRPKRNVVALKALTTQAGASTILIGSTSTTENEALRDELEAAGVRVIREVVPVEDFYRLSDCYIFPVFDHEGSVEIPLSVLEAMACGTPVLSRPFGGLRDVLPAGDDLCYWETTDELAETAKMMRSKYPVTVRSMDQFAWSTVAHRLLSCLEGGDDVRHASA